LFSVGSCAKKERFVPQVLAGALGAVRTELDRLPGCQKLLDVAFRDFGGRCLGASRSAGEAGGEHCPDEQHSRSHRAFSGEEVGKWLGRRVAEARVLKINECRQASRCREVAPHFNLSASACNNEAVDIKREAIRHCTQPIE
jgi:hypothetical protein